MDECNFGLLFADLPFNVILLYRVGHEKVARLSFCTCPYDILSGVSMNFVLSV